MNLSICSEDPSVRTSLPAGPVHKLALVQEQRQTSLILFPARPRKFVTAPVWRPVPTKTAFRRGHQKNENKNLVSPRKTG